MTDPTILRLHKFGVAWSGEPILAEIDLELPARGLVVLVGPAGAGKSTLLRTLAGLNRAHPSLTTWGSAELGGVPLAEVAWSTREQRIGLVVQHSRFFLSTVRENLVSALANRNALTRAEQDEVVCSLLARAGIRDGRSILEAEVVALPQPLQRLLAVVRATAAEPLVLLADEPTSGLDDEAAREVVDLLRREARSRAVLFVTHNQRHALAAEGTTYLLAGGNIVDSGVTEEFFTEPKTTPGKSFVKTGNCVLPSPGAELMELGEETPPPPPLPAAAREARGQRVGPRGFFWVLPQALGGLPRPGIVAELEDDLAGLRQLGVNVLVTLEETPTVSPTVLRANGINSLHFPIPDMGVPALDRALELCSQIDGLLEARLVVALHCLAGLGRTGTLLACQLVWRGKSAVLAIEEVRRISPRCIQSDEQIVFIGKLEMALRTDPRRSTNTDVVGNEPIDRSR